MKRIVSSSLKKTSDKTHPFYRVDLSSQEIESLTNRMYDREKSYRDNLLNLSRPPYKQVNMIPSLYDLVVGRDVLSEMRNADDENMLFAIWQDSSNDEPVISSSDVPAYQATRLVRHGYLTEEEGRYRLTEKGKKAVMSKVLGTSPLRVKSSLKTAQTLTNLKDRGSQGISQGFSGQLEIDGEQIPYKDRVPDSIGNVTGWLVENRTEYIKILNKKGIPFQETTSLVLFVPFNNNIREVSLGEEGPDPGVFDNMGDQVMGEHPWNRSGKIAPVLKQFSNAKLVSMMKYASKQESELISEEMNSRRLKPIILADNDMERMKGLMHHPGLREDECAVFYFQNPGSYSFWNKNVGFDIDVVSFDKQGNLICQKMLKAHQESPIHLGENVQFVVETSHGWFDRKKANPGDSIWSFVQSF